MTKKDNKIYSSFKDMALDSDKPVLDDKIKKNYFRLYLNKTKGMPMILTGKYKQHDNHMATFTCIRPYIKGIRTRTITDHVNIFVKEFDNVVDLSTLIKNQKYYIICYGRPYNDESGRYGVSLAKDVTHNCIFHARDVEKFLTEELISKCFKFSNEEFFRKRGMLCYLDDILSD
jgi:hypothetical protein